MPHMLKEALSTVLPPEEVSQLYSAFDMIGDIVIIKIPDTLIEKKTLIGGAILENVKTAKSVFMQSSAVRGDYRIRDLEFVSGVNKTLTEYREHGCRFRVDVAKTYFSPRLSTERERIASLVADGEVIVNMFGGVGTYSIVIARKHKKCLVYNIDSNEAAAELCRINSVLNKVNERVVSIHDDADAAIRRTLTGIGDRVLMPLPERASSYVESAIAALKAEGGMIHYFCHLKADNKAAAGDAAISEVDRAFAGHDVVIKGIKIVREVGPRIYQVVADTWVGGKSERI